MLISTESVVARGAPPVDKLMMSKYLPVVCQRNYEIAGISIDRSECGDWIASR